MDQKHPTTKIPHHESETPPHSPTIKRISFPNGKTNHHHPPAVTYRECLKNHAAGIGGHALDGCGEYMPSPSEPSSYQCEACGCHRNFHRREPTSWTNFINFHRPSPPSPPPQPTSYAYGQHQLVLSLSTAPEKNKTAATPVAMKISGGKRFRTKFSNDQKEKMLCFAEKVGWKMQRCEDKMVTDFCKEIGIRRGVFKVWMHNNKNTLAKRDKNTTTAGTGGCVRSSDSNHQEHGSSSSS